MGTLHTNIVLTGFMGTGKSTVGRLLAERLGYTWVDTDELIEREHGPIPEIFESEGEAAFRAYERAVAAELGTADAHVISTGGRLMLDPVNAAAFGDCAVFCLTARVETIAERTLDDGVDRPLLAADDRGARIAALLQERAPGYAQFEQVSTDDRPVDSVVDEITTRLARRSDR